MTKGNPFFASKETVLRRERERMGLSCADLARIAWMNVSEVSKIELGRVLPYEKQARRIASAIQWSGELEDLFKPVED